VRLKDLPEDRCEWVDADVSSICGTARPEQQFDLVILIRRIPPTAAPPNAPARYKAINLLAFN